MTSLDPTFLTLSASALADLIRSGDLTPVEVVDAHIRRIEAVNPRLNALVAERFAAARTEAGQAGALRDRLVRAGEPLPPLLGVPFTVKEMIGLEGMPHTFGCLDRQGRTAPRDATAVRRLRAAGAIPLGVSNVPEWGFWFETNNLVYGRTSNPFDPKRTAGGSSGGEAAIIGAGGSPFGLGSDIGGSIRIPAGFCGIFGHKPTHGLVPLTGHYPVYADGSAGVRKANPWVVIGPLARSARDLMPLLRIMAGPDGVDPNAERLKPGDAGAASDWRGRTVLLLDDPRIVFACRASEEMREATRRAGRSLEARGAIVKPLPDDFFRDAVDLWHAALASLDGPTLAETVRIDRLLDWFAAVVRTAVLRPRLSLPVLMLGLGERLGATRRRRMEALVAEGRALGERLDGRLGADGVLLMPAHPRAAPRHNAPLLRPFDFAFTAILNVLRIPVTVVPMGLDRHGLPLSVQVAASRGGDHRTIAAAMALEEAFGGWAGLRAAADGASGSRGSA